VALARAFRRHPEVSVHAGDWNPRAVRLARRNVERNGLAGRVEVRRSELFSAFADLEGSVDVLLSNPPYIAPAEADSLPLEVRVGDPGDALFDPAGGTGFHRRIAKRGLDFLADGGTLAMEMGEAQGDELLELLAGLGYEDPRVLRDLAGRERFVRGVRPTR
jgi:release factor glutamine methyltransferase